MQEANFNSTPLTQSVIYKSFSHAIKETGLPEFAQQVFISEMNPRLKSAATPFPANEQSLTKLWKSILRGQVIATEVWNSETLVFYVRGGFRGIVVDVRLTCHEHQWHVESVISIHSRPLVHSPWFHRTEFVGAVVVAAVLGYAVHHPNSEVKQPLAQHTAAVLNSVNVGNRDASHEADSQSAQNQPASHTVTFTLSRGTSLYDLSKFLHDQHLVGGTMAFEMVMKKSGVDRSIKPGVYTFRTGMSESQIIEVLQHGPSKS